MKTRNSLVSNSSSASFILIGIPIDTSLLNEANIEKDPKAPFHTYVIGKELGEGKDVFWLSAESQLKFMRDYPHLFKQAFVNAKYYYDPEFSGLKVTDIINGLNAQQVGQMIIVSGRADQNSSYNVSCMIQNYGREIEVSLKKAAEQLLNDRYGIKKNENTKRFS